MKKIFFIVAVTFLITGYGANTGHQFLEKMSHSEISDKLVKHQTSKEQVKELFGEPEDIDMQDDDGETWLYKYIRSEAKGVNFVPIASNFYGVTNDSITKFKIKFNNCGLVERFAFSSSKGETKGGLFQ